MTLPSFTNMISARGRLFTIEDRGSIEHPVLPGRFFLYARNAFNGVTLWKKAIPTWETITRKTKHMPVQIQRRLAAHEDMIYYTPGLEAGIIACRAADGSEVMRYAGTERTQEFCLTQNMIFAVVGDAMSGGSYSGKSKDFKGGLGTDPEAPFHGTGFKGSYTKSIRSKRKKACVALSLTIV